MPWHSNAKEVSVLMLRAPVSCVVCAWLKQAFPGNCYRFFDSPTSQVEFKIRPLQTIISSGYEHRSDLDLSGVKLSTSALISLSFISYIWPQLLHPPKMTRGIFSNTTETTNTASNITDTSRYLATYLARGEVPVQKMLEM